MPIYTPNKEKPFSTESCLIICHPGIILVSILNGEVHKMDYEKTGRLIRKKREAMKISQRQFADMVGVTSQAVSLWECGRRFPDADAQVMLFKMTGLNPIELLKSPNWVTLTVIAVVAVLVAIVVLCVVHRRRRKRHQHKRKKYQL